MKNNKGVFYSGIFNYVSSNYIATCTTRRKKLKKAPQLMLGASHNMWR